MIEIKIDGSRVSAMKAEGSTVFLAGEMGIAIRALYDAIKEESEGAAELFKRMMGKVTDPGSPVWEEENAGETIDLSPELKDAIRKLMEGKQ